MSWQSPINKTSSDALQLAFLTFGSISRPSVPEDCNLQINAWRLKQMRRRHPTGLRKLALVSSPSTFFWISLNSLGERRVNAQLHMCYRKGRQSAHMGETRERTPPRPTKSKSDHRLQGNMSLNPKKCVVKACVCPDTDDRHYYATLSDE